MSVKAEWLASRLNAEWRNRVIGEDPLPLAEFVLAELERWDAEQEPRPTPVGPFSPFQPFRWPGDNGQWTPGQPHIHCDTTTPLNGDDEVLRFHGVGTADSPWVPADDDLDSVLD